MTEPTPSHHPGQHKRYADFSTIAQALDYAAEGPTGLNFYSGKGQVTEALPYRTLRHQAIQLARRMLGAGLMPGDRVGLIAESDGDFVRAFFACQYARLVPAPLPLPAAFGGKDNYIAHLRRMIESAQASAAFGPALLQPWLAEAVAGRPGMAGTLALLDDVVPLAGDLPEQDPNDLSYLQYSSGSTRFPIGVAVTQRAFMANARGSGRSLGIVEGDRGVSWLPFHHDMGLVGFLLTPVACQMTVDVIPTRDFARRPLLWLHLISANRGTVSFSPSFGYELCMRRAGTGTTVTNGLELSSWRSAGIGGDMIRPDVLARFAERFETCGFDAHAFVPSYGMAEATLALSFTRPGEGARRDTVDAFALENKGSAIPARDSKTRTRTFILCGQMLPGHDIEVRDDSNRILTERQVGRIFVRGPSLMQGYFGAPEETARVMAEHGWLDTGDLGYVVSGQVVITGRAKDLIIVNGRNLWPQDLEWAVEEEIEALRSGDVAVFSVQGEMDEEVVALVQCRTPDTVQREILAAEIANIFRGRHGLESKIVLVPPHSLPQTSSGKLSRSRARSLYLQGAFERGSVQRQSVNSE